MFGDKTGALTEVESKWQKDANDRFIRFGGSEVNRSLVDGKRRWIAMVPGFSGDRQTCWMALQADGVVISFGTHTDAINAVEEYLAKYQ